MRRADEVIHFAGGDRRRNDLAGPPALPRSAKVASRFPAARTAGGDHERFVAANSRVAVFPREHRRLDLRECRFAVEDPPTNRRIGHPNVTEDVMVRHRAHVADSAGTSRHAKASVEETVQADDGHPARRNRSSVACCTLVEAPPPDMPKNIEPGLVQAPLVALGLKRRDVDRRDANRGLAGLGTIHAQSWALPRCVVILAAGALALGAQVPANWGLGLFVRPADVNPAIAPLAASVFFCPMRQTQIHWEALHTFNPAAVVRNGKVYVLYRAEDSTGEMQIGMHTSRLGLAESGDGLHFTRGPSPVLYPADDGQKEREWEGGCEDPRVTESPDGTYVLTYTQWNRKITDTAIATSKDLLAWTKHGPAFAQASGGKYLRLFHKSAGIVSRISGDRLIAARINGKYWMYWGEGEVRLATSSK